MGILSKIVEKIMYLLTTPIGELAGTLHAFDVITLIWISVPIIVAKVYDYGDYSCFSYDS